MVPRTAVPLASAALAALALAAAGAGGAAAAEWRLDPERSVLAVLTHRAGVAARLAHDHLVVAVRPAATLDFDPNHPEATRFSATANVLALEIDAAAERAALGPRLVELGVLAGGLPPVDPGDREKVRAAMLARDQLDAAGFPEITGELVALAPRAGGNLAAKGAAFAWEARIRLTVRGKTVEKSVPVRWQVDNGELTAEALGELAFSDFGITPYSRFLGAVANQDGFHLYVRVVARSAAATPPPG